MRKHSHIENLKAASPEAGHPAIAPGRFVAQSLRDRDRDLFGCILDQLHKDLTINTSIDILQIELVALYSVRMLQAQDAGDSNAAEAWDRMIRLHLKDLRIAVKRAREGAASASRPADRHGTAK